MLLEQGSNLVRLVSDLQDTNWKPSTANLNLGTNSNYRNYKCMKLKHNHTKVIENTNTQIQGYDTDSSLTTCVRPSSNSQSNELGFSFYHVKSQLQAGHSSSIKCGLLTYTHLATTHSNTHNALRRGNCSLTK